MEPTRFQFLVARFVGRDISCDIRSEVWGNIWQTIRFRLTRHYGKRSA